MSNFWEELFIDPATLAQRRVGRVETRLAEATASQLDATRALHDEVLELRYQVHYLTKTVWKLSAMTSVLAQGLGKSGAFDEKWAQEELRAALERIDPPQPEHEPQPQPTAGSPYRGAPRQERPPPQAVAKARCASCSAEVDASTTTFTEQGVVCDPCNKRLELERLERLELEGAG